MASVHLAQPFGAAPALAVLQQQALGVGAPGRERGLQRLGDGAAQRLLVAAVLLRELVELGGERALVEQFDVAVREVWSEVSMRHPDSGARGSCHRSAAKSEEEAHSKSSVAGNAMPTCWHKRLNFSR